MGRYQESGFIMRDAHTKGHIEGLSLKNVKIRKPTIICLGGDMTPNPSIINIFCESIEGIIGLRVSGPQDISSYKDIDIIGFYYGKDNESDKTYSFSEQDIDDIVNSMLLPLCVDDDGKLLPLEQICENFSLLNFVTHCRGAYELYKITKRLHDILLEKGLTNEEAHQIYAHSFHCSYASNYRESFYPTMYVYSLTDGCFRGLKWEYEDAYGEILDGVSVKHNPPGKFMTVNINPRDYYNSLHHDTIIVFTSRLVNKPPKCLIKSIYDEHSFWFLRRDPEEWVLAKTEDSVYTPNADLVSQMVAYGMSVNLVASLKTFHTGKIAKRMPILELKDELESLIASFDQEDLKIQR